MRSQAGFLYDYYGMTEETRLDPPSPGHSHSIDDKEHNGAIDIPTREDEIVRHTSFSDSIKSMGYGGNSSGNCSRRGQSSPSPNREKMHGSNASSCQSPSSINEDEIQRGSFNYIQKQGFTPPQDRYIFTLEAQTSIVQKRGCETLTYVNKGQFYYLVFECHQATKLSRVRTIVHLVFGNEKDPAVELAHWRYWYNQQPNPNQRAFDIDIKACQMVDGEIEEVGYNALAVVWNPNVPAKISFRINCLSTDFSAQKGVKGIPLHLQIDTYEDLSSNGEPIHRSFCQVKVFRDKGAERKNKDESKIFGKKMVKYLKGGEGAPSDVSNVYQMASKVTVLYSTQITAKSVVFCPSKDMKTTTYCPSPTRREYVQNVGEHSSPSSSISNNYINVLRERENKRGFSSALSNAKDNLEHLDVLPRPKAARVNKRKEPAVTLYVRKEEEKAYNALMLDSLTLEDFKKEVARKYGVPVDMIKSVFKKTKKGILVNMDDQLIEQVEDEDDFIITIDFDNQLGHFEVILNCG